MEKEVLLKALMERRSVRSFTDDQINKEILDKIIKVGQLAPSAMNRQDYKITVVMDKKLREEIILKLRESLKDENYNGFYDAPVYILISSPKENPNGNLDAACVALNIMNAASILDIATVWVNQFKGKSDEPSIRDLLEKLEIPKDHKIDVSIALGKSDSEIHKDRQIKSTISFK